MSEQVKPSDFNFQNPTWCPGCGDFGVLGALKEALAALDRPPHEVALVSGVGCGAKLNEYTYCYGLHGIHGRALPMATGLKVARPDLTVVAAGGDGDAYGIGGGAFVHTARRNVDLVYVVLDNQVYGLTKGQISPTSPRGMKTPTTPLGGTDRPLVPLALALSAGAGFVAQGFSSRKAELVELIQQALTHPGFALVNVLSPCVTFNRERDYPWYRDNLRPLAKENHDPSDLSAAMNVAISQDGLLPVGLLYRRLGEISISGQRCDLWEEELTLDPEKFNELLGTD